jgi:PPOX class probable F420-dependent enzyme
VPRLSARQARERFAHAPVARLATLTPAGRPHQVPVVHACVGDILVLAVDHKPKSTTRLQRLTNIAAHPEVCLLADGWHEDWDRLWWARADGTATIRPPAAASAASAQLLTHLVRRYPRHYGRQPPQGPLITVAVRRWSGWRAG